ncbi:17037_t:CDS:2, partial [Cetraspora pellucida]
KMNVVVDKLKVGIVNEMKVSMSVVDEIKVSMSVVNEDEVAFVNIKDLILVADIEDSILLF